MTRPNLINAETLCCIARLGTFQAAAEHLFTTQPAVSARMKELEQALGTKLFHRRGRGLELTMEARRFVERVEPLLRAVEGVFTEANTQNMGGTVRVGLGDISMTWFAGIVSDLRKTLPRIAYEVEMDLAGNLRQRLEAGKLDMMIMAGRLNDEHLVCEPIGSTRMLWVVSAGMMRDEKGNRRTAEYIMRNSTLWTVPRTSAFYTEGLRRARRMGVNLDNICTCNRIAGMIQMVEQGSGFARLPEIMVQDQLRRGELVILDPKLPVSNLEFTIAYHRDDDQPIVRLVTQAAQRMGRRALEASQKSGGTQ